VYDSTSSSASSLSTPSSTTLVAPPPQPPLSRSYGHSSRPDTAVLELHHLLEETILFPEIVDLNLEFAVLVLEVANVALYRLDVLLLLGSEASSCVV